MKQIKTRCKNSTLDYQWFGVSECPTLDTFTKNICNDANDFSICIEIDGDKWNVLFGQLQSSSQDSGSRGIRYFLRGTGDVGDDDALFFYKLFHKILGDVPDSYDESVKKIGKLFDERFTDQYLSSIYKKSNQNQVEKDISDILDDIVKDDNLSDNITDEFKIIDEIEESINVELSYKSNNHNKFLRMLNYLIKQQNNFDKIVLIYTSGKIKSINSVYPTGNISVAIVESLYKELEPEVNRCLVYILTSDNTSDAINHSFTVKKKSRMKSQMTSLSQESNRRTQNSSENSGKASSKSSEITKTSTKSQNGIKDSLSGYLLPAMLVCGLLVGFGLGYVTSLVLNNKSSHGKLNDNEFKIQSDWKAKYDIEHKQLGDLSDDYNKLKSDYSEVKKAFEDLYHETIQIFKKFYKEYHESFDLDQTDDEVPKQTQNVKKKH